MAWLIEKTAIALGEAARLVDLANEPDTNAWYREALKAAALPMIARPAPVVAVLCDRPETANEPHKWELIAEGGTPALRAWIAQHDFERDIGDCVSSVGPSPSTPHAIAHVATRTSRSRRFRRTSRIGLRSRRVC